MELDPDISSAISLAELDSDFQPTEFQLNFDMPDLLMENDGQDGGIEAADVSSLLEQFEEASNSISSIDDLKTNNDMKIPEKNMLVVPLIESPHNKRCLGENKIFK